MPAHQTMFGTIGHFRPKPGHEAQIDALLDEWQRTIRPSVPGAVTNISGHCTTHNGEIVAVVLMQDEQTYRNLAASEEQDRWYHRLLEHLQAEPEWEDIAWNQVSADAMNVTA
jgi:hypothetical protein